VIGEHLPSVFVAGGQAKLGRDRIGLDVNAQLGRKLLVVKLGRADDVEQRVARAVELK
jgi:hypothetical protein